MPPAVLINLIGGIVFIVLGLLLLVWPGPRRHATWLMNLYRLSSERASKIGWLVPVGATTVLLLGISFLLWGSLEVAQGDTGVWHIVAGVVLVLGSVPGFLWGKDALRSGQTTPELYGRWVDGNPKFVMLKGIASAVIGLAMLISSLVEMLR